MSDCHDDQDSPLPLRPIKAQPLSGSERIHDDGTPVQPSKGSSMSVESFWRWAYSDLVDNTNRGVLAEFLVGRALGLDLEVPREAWSDFDLTYRGHGIEVKASGRHQAWAQERPSACRFVIPRSQGWDAETNRVDTVKKRRASLYVLCHHAEEDRDRVDPLDVSQWRFWILATESIENALGSQASLGLTTLSSVAGAPHPWQGIREAVDAIVNRKEPQERD